MLDELFLHLEGPNTHMHVGAVACMAALAAILAAVVVLWVTEALPMPVTALLGAAMAVVLRVAPARDVFAPFADPLNRDNAGAVYVIYGTPAADPPAVSPAVAAPSFAPSPNTSSTRAVQRTSFVRVSRSAMNHSPQPERCSHHSRCGPATFVRK